MRLFGLGVLLLAIFLVYTTPAFAREKPFLADTDLSAVNITQFEAINPNLLIYPFKRAGETAKIFLAFNKKDKDEYLLKLLDIRFKELVYIIDFNKTGFIAFSTDRYMTTIGQIKNRAIKADSTKIKKYLNLLEKLRDRYHSSSANWEKIQQAVDTTNTIL